MIRKLFSRQNSCGDSLRHLQSYLDGESDSKTARKVAGHLADCPACDSELTLFKQIKASLRSPKVDVDPKVLMAIEDFGRRISETDRPSP